MGGCQSNGWRPFRVGAEQPEIRVSHNICVAFLVAHGVIAPLEMGMSLAVLGQTVVL